MERLAGSPGARGERVPFPKLQLPHRLTVGSTHVDATSHMHPLSEQQVRAGHTSMAYTMIKSRSFLLSAHLHEIAAGQRVSLPGRWQENRSSLFVTVLIVYNSVFFLIK